MGRQQPLLFGGALAVGGPEGVAELAPDRLGELRQFLLQRLGQVFLCFDSGGLLELRGLDLDRGGPGAIRIGVE
jgi:hypothetical protein